MNGLNDVSEVVREKLRNESFGGINVNLNNVEFIIDKKSLYELFDNMRFYQANSIFAIIDNYKKLSKTNDWFKEWLADSLFKQFPEKPGLFPDKTDYWLKDLTWNSSNPSDNSVNLNRVYVNNVFLEKTAVHKTDSFTALEFKATDYLGSIDLVIIERFNQLNLSKNPFLPSEIISGVLDKNPHQRSKLLFDIGAVPLSEDYPIVQDLALSRGKMLLAYSISRSNLSNPASPDYEKQLDEVQDNVIDTSRSFLSASFNDLVNEYFRNR